LRSSSRHGLTGVTAGPRCRPSSDRAPTLGQDTSATANPVQVAVHFQARRTNHRGGCQARRALVCHDASRRTAAAANINARFPSAAERSHSATAHTRRVTPNADKYSESEAKPAAPVDQHLRGFQFSRDPVSVATVLGSAIASVTRNRPSAAQGLAEPLRLKPGSSTWASTSALMGIPWPRLHRGFWRRGGVYWAPWESSLAASPGVVDRRR
jgi:hypothetical protein